MPSSSTNELKIEQAKRDQYLFSLLAAFYNNIPDENLFKALKQIVPGEIEDNEFRGLFTSLKTYVEKLDPADEKTILDIKHDWTKLFRGVSPDYGPKPPYEQLYTSGGEIDTISAIADIYISNDYEGYELIGNRQDYLGVQLDFLAKLASKRTEAIENSDDKMYEALTAVTETFINEHIAIWLPRFYREAAKQAESEFYKDVLKLTALVFE